MSQIGMPMARCEVDLHDYASPQEAQSWLLQYFTFYNRELTIRSYRTVAPPVMLYYAVSPVSRVRNPIARWAGAA